jgi:hypothetical protein
MGEVEIMNMTEPMANYARGIVGFLIDVRGIAPDDLEPEIVADAMIAGVDVNKMEPLNRAEWQERWDDCYRVAARVLVETGR